MVGRLVHHDEQRGGEVDGQIADHLQQHLDAARGCTERDDVVVHPRPWARIPAAPSTPG